MIWSRPLRLNDWRGRPLRSCIGARERSSSERPWATPRGLLFFGRVPSIGKMLEIASAHFEPRVPARSTFSRSACRAMPRRRLNAFSVIASPTSNAFSCYLDSPHPSKCADCGRSRRGSYTNRDNFKRRPPRTQALTTMLNSPSSRRAGEPVWSVLRYSTS